VQGREKCVGPGNPVLLAARKRIRKGSETAAEPDNKKKGKRKGTYPKRNGREGRGVISGKGNRLWLCLT